MVDRRCSTSIQCLENSRCFLLTTIQICQFMSSPKRDNCLRILKQLLVNPYNRIIGKSFSRVALIRVTHEQNSVFTGFLASQIQFLCHFYIGHRLQSQRVNCREISYNNVWMIFVNKLDCFQEPVFFRTEKSIPFDWFSRWWVNMYSILARYNRAHLHAFF